jgi:hypothetical protein
MDLKVEMIEQIQECTRLISKIPGSKENQHIPNHAQLGQIIAHSRRDIVADLLHVYLRFMHECNLMANCGGETIEWSETEAKKAFEVVTPKKNDLHPRHVGIAFFDLASNLVANWEEAYINMCKDFLKEITEETQPQPAEPSEQTPSSKDTSHESDYREEHLQTSTAD